jgi:hypothetical protein
MIPTFEEIIACIASGKYSIEQAKPWLEIHVRRTSLTTAAHDVVTERARQVSAEGWTPEHDDEHATGELALAAASYAFSNKLQPAFWPWEESAWKPKDERSNLVRAAALLLAEIERLDRKSGA